ncbi:MAG: hypothetical protein SWX82_04840 [Cyanobacteriota bacterium]|nr:hypothetical protein [Cyanobacteriota bacterium]
MNIFNRILNQKTTSNNHRDRGLLYYGKCSIAASMIVTAGFLGACDTGETETQAPVETTTDVEDVAENTNQLIGTTVTLTGEVEEILSPNTFVLQENGDLFNDDKVLIILSTIPEQPIVEDKNVQVVGTVRQLVVAEFERDYDLGWDLEVKRKLEAEYSSIPAVVAELAKPL